MSGFLMHMSYVKWLEEGHVPVPPGPVPPGPVPPPVPPGPEVLTIDGLDYRTVKIGGQVWMAENCQAEQGDSHFFDDDEATYGREGRNYGRMYPWLDAMALAERVPGWHLPTIEDWVELAEFAGGMDVASPKLKSASDLWEYVPGTDDYGFGVLPSGVYRFDWGYRNDGTEANFWTATNEGQTNITCVRLGNDTKVWTQKYVKSQYMQSVRLVKD